jgi:PAS domain S-box-containing protein
MKRLFESLSRTSDGAFVIDGRHRIIFWNQAAEEILGYTAEEVSGLQCYEIMSGRDEQGRSLCHRFCRVAIRAEKGEALPSHDAFVRTRTGAGRWLNISAFVYTDTDKSSGQVIAHLFRDITDQKNYQRFVHGILEASEQLRKNGGYHKLSVAQFEPQVDGLTMREQQVLGLLAQGLGTGEMAHSMTVSPATVRNHVQNILGKLGVHSRLEAIAYAHQHGLIATTGQKKSLR